MRAETAVFHAQADGANHRWDVDVSLGDAPEGTYVLLFSTDEPAVTPVAIKESDPILKCPTGRARRALPEPTCTIAGHGEVVSVARIGVGGAGELRAAFDGGNGGWFSVVRADDGKFVSTDRVPYDVRIVSEAITKDDKARRFTIDVSPNRTSGRPTS